VPIRRRRNARRMGGGPRRVHHDILGHFFSINIKMVVDWLHHRLVLPSRPGMFHRAAKASAVTAQAMPYRRTIAVVLVAVVYHPLDLLPDSRGIARVEACVPRKLITHAAELITSAGAAHATIMQLERPEARTVIADITAGALSPVDLEQVVRLRAAILLDQRRILAFSDNRRSAGLMIPWRA